MSSSPTPELGPGVGGGLLGAGWSIQEDVVAGADGESVGVLCVVPAAGGAVLVGAGAGVVGVGVGGVGVGGVGVGAVAGGGVGAGAVDGGTGDGGGVEVAAVEGGDEDGGGVDVGAVDGEEGGGVTVDCGAGGCVAGVDGPAGGIPVASPEGVPGAGLDDEAPGPVVVPPAASAGGGPWGGTPASSGRPTVADGPSAVASPEDPPGVGAGSSSVRPGPSPSRPGVLPPCPGALPPASDCCAVVVAAAEVPESEPGPVSVLVSSADVRNTPGSVSAPDAETAQAMLASVALARRAWATRSGGRVTPRDSDRATTTAAQARGTRLRASSAVGMPTVTASSRPTASAPPRTRSGDRVCPCHSVGARRTATSGLPLVQDLGRIAQEGRAPGNRPRPGPGLRPW